MYALPLLSGGARLALGAEALSAAPKWSIDVWTPDPESTASFDTSYDFVAGVAVPLRMEYRKPSGNGNVELQWSLIGDANASLHNATAAAAAADATIVVVGGSDQTTNEGCDRAELDLPGNQLGLVQAVHAASKRLVVVMTGGRPIAEPWIKENVGSVIASMCGGQAQGTALAAVIAGSYNPSGKLPVSFPRSAATLPVYCAPPCPTTPLFQDLVTCHDSFM